MEQYTNLATSTLASAVIATDTTLTLAAGASFPTGSFTILIDTELIRVTSRATNVLTVTRGTEGTTAAIHASGGTVTHVISSAVLNAIRAEINSYGTTLPTSGRAGNRHQFPDGSYSIHDGTVWQDFYNGIKVKRPVLSDFGFFADPGTNTYTQVGNTINVTSSSNANQFNAATLFGKTLTGTQVTIGVENFYVLGQSYASLGIADASNVFIDIVWGTENNTSNIFYVLGHPSATVNDQVYLNTYVSSNAYMFLRIRITGGNRYYELSNDNQNWYTFFVHADGTLMIQTRLVFGHIRYNMPTEVVSGTKVFHFEEL